MHADADLSLFGRCPLPGCAELVADALQPCPACLAAFGAILHPTGAELDDDEHQAAVDDLARRDEETRAALAWQRSAVQTCRACGLVHSAYTGTPLVEGCPLYLAELRAEVAAEGPTPARRICACWICDERRKCHRDPEHPDRWICRTCAEVTP